MKVHINICIDPDVAEELKTENASSLINSYLRHYFNLGSTIKSDEQLKQALIDEQTKKDMEAAF